MGSPLASILGNIFMGFYESKWLNEYNLNKPNFYLRYVDDILAAFVKPWCNGYHYCTTSFN